VATRSDTPTRGKPTPRAWLPEALVLAALAVAGSALFALTPLDITAARYFYRAGSPDHWPLAHHPPWSLLYAAAPWITGALVVAGLALLGAGWVRRRPAVRVHGVFLLLAIALGPGLLVNFVFKDHWARPRPREIVTFAGPLEYVPAPLPGHQGGASFPCGHCSVGFLCGAGWWLWKRRRPRRARLALAIGIVCGVALGLGRLAAGAHFLSDVLWSAILAYGVCHLLCYHVLHLDSEATGPTPAGPGARLGSARVTALAGVLGGVAVLVALFAPAHGIAVHSVIRLASLAQPPRGFEFEARAADVEVVLLDGPAIEVSVTGELHGFGLPGSRLASAYELARTPEPTLHYRYEQRGWFTDLGGFATVLLPAAAFGHVAVHVGRGNITVRDDTRAALSRSGGVQLELTTGSGRVTVRERGA
jgi:lipid A 4'-phosphatase